MLDPLVHPARRCLLRIDRLEDVGDRSAWHVCGVERSEPLGGRPSAKRVGDQGTKRFAIRRPGPHSCAKRGSTASPRQPDRLAESRPLAFLNRRRQRSAGLPSRTARTGRCSGARCRRRSARPGHKRVLRLVDEDRERRFEERDVDRGRRPPDAARRRAAPDERREHADGPEQARDDVADRDADLRRLAAVRVCGTGDRHQTADGLGDEVVAGLVCVGPGRARSRRSRGG